MTYFEAMKLGLDVISDTQACLADFAETNEPIDCIALDADVLLEQVCYVQTVTWLHSIGIRYFYP